MVSNSAGPFILDDLHGPSGVYEAESEEAAIGAFAIDSGFASAAEAADIIEWEPSVIAIKEAAEKR